jgi:Tfp pilus assembly protein FimT
MIEMLLVIVILAVIAGLSVPSFKKSFSGMELKNQAQELVYLMRYAQSHAVTKGVRVRLNIDLGSKKYFLTEAQEEKTPPDFKPIVGQMGHVYQLSQSLDFEANDHELDFFPDGTIEKKQMRLCLEKECFVISTQEQRANIRMSSATR